MKKHILMVIVITFVLVLLVINLGKRAIATALTFVNNIRCPLPACTVPTDMTLVVQTFPSDLILNKHSILFYKSSMNFLNTLLIAARTDVAPVIPRGMTVISIVNLANALDFAVIAKASGTTRYVIAIRGTQNITDSMIDARTGQVFTTGTPFATSNPSSMCHRGFLARASTTLSMLKIPVDASELLVCGHSLGAAVALLVGVSIRKHFKGQKMRIVLSGCPRVGNYAFKEDVEKDLEIYRFENRADIIPTLPLSVEPNSVEPTKPFIYTHCGGVAVYESNWSSLLNNHAIGNYLTFLREWTPF
jgi:hypothetical protein